MSRRMWVLAVAAWLAVVVVGSGLTWVAIDRAGQQVTDPDDLPTQVAIGTLDPSPAGTPTEPGTGSPTGPPPGSAPPPPSSPATRAAPKAVSRTWTGAAGTVTVACTGDSGRLLGASPNEGWRVEHDDDVDDSVEVKFERGEEIEVKVRARCTGGVPRFEVESGSDD